MLNKQMQKIVGAAMPENIQEDFKMTQQLSAKLQIILNEWQKDLKGMHKTMQDIEKRVRKIEKSSKQKPTKKDVEIVMQNDHPFKPKVGYKKRFKIWWQHRERLFVYIFRNNNTIDVEVVLTRGKQFVYRGGRYIIDRDFCKWSDSLGMMTAMYFENVSLPVNLNLDEKALVRTIEDNIGDAHVVMNANPHVLEDTVKTEVIQKLIRGEELENLLNLIKLLSILTLTGVALLLVAFFMFAG